MCSYPCFGLSKTGFTPPSQLFKLIIFLKIENCVAADAEIGNQNCVAADTEIDSENCVAADAEIDSENCVAADQEIGSENCFTADAEIGSQNCVAANFMPMQKSAAKTASSILYIYIYIFFFLLGVYNIFG